MKSENQQLWAISMLMDKVETDGWKTTTTTRQMLGYQHADSVDEAIGIFMRRCLKENPGFSAGNPIFINIPTTPQ